MRSGSPCLGCGCNYSGLTSGYCGNCECNVCNICGGMGVKYEVCIQCRRARGSKE